jgi:hypothetical protein
MIKFINLLNSHFYKNKKRANRIHTITLGVFILSLSYIFTIIQSLNKNHPELFTSARFFLVLSLIFGFIGIVINSFIFKKSNFILLLKIYGVVFAFIILGLFIFLPEILIQ